MRDHYRSPSPYEGLHGFARAVRIGSRIAVSGTAPIGPDGQTVAGDTCEQAKQCFEVFPAATKVVVEGLDRGGGGGVGMRALVLWMVLAAAAAGWASDERPKLDFAIEDQFGELHTDEDCGGAVVILLGGDRKGSAHIDDWAPDLHRALASELDEGEVCSVGFANLKGAPFFVKKKIVKSFPKDPEAWTRLDWKGAIARTWGFEKNAANLYVFDRGGDLVHHFGLRDFEQVQLDRIVEEVRLTVAGK